MKDCFAKINADGLKRRENASSMKLLYSSASRTIAADDPIKHLWF
jgi:hypothetical protein